MGFFLSFEVPLVRKERENSVRECRHGNLKDLTFAFISTCIKVSDCNTVRTVPVVHKSIPTSIINHLWNVYIIINNVPLCFSLYYMIVSPGLTLNLITLIVSPLHVSLTYLREEWTLLFCKGPTTL